MVKVLKMEDVPAEILSLAVQSANLIGNGLYGVDLKQVDDNIFVIEVNDNPNIDANLEDQIAGDVLYKKILEHLVHLTL